MPEKPLPRAESRLDAVTAAELDRLVKLLRVGRSAVIRLAIAHFARHHGVSDDTTPAREAP